MPRPSMKQRETREINWALYRLSGARSVFNSQLIELLSPEEQALAAQADAAIRKLIESLRKRNIPK